MTAKETLELISKQWCNLTDLMKLLNCGRNKALEVKNEIRNRLLKDGYYLPNNNLPMQAVVDILKIDIERLKKILELNK